MSNPGIRTWDVQDLVGDAAYHLLTSLVVPRPIAWVSTADPDGIPNLAPYSFFNVLSSVPPIVYFSAGSNSKDGSREVGLKDSVRNAQETGEFAVNIVSDDLLDAMVATSKSHSRAVSEFDVAGLQRARCRKIGSPCVEAARAVLECTVERVMEIGLSVIVLGEVVSVSVKEDVIREDRVDAAALSPVARLGGSQYMSLGDILVRRRPR